MLIDGNPVSRRGFLKEVVELTGKLVGATVMLPSLDPLKLLEPPVQSQHLVQCPQDQQDRVAYFTDFMSKEIPLDPNTGDEFGNLGVEFLRSDYFPLGGGRFVYELYPNALNGARFPRRHTVNSGELGIANFFEVDELGTLHVSGGFGTARYAESVTIDEVLRPNTPDSHLRNLAMGLYFGWTDIQRPDYNPRRPYRLAGVWLVKPSLVGQYPNIQPTKVFFDGYRIFEIPVTFALDCTIPPSQPVPSI